MEEKFHLMRENKKEGKIRGRKKKNWRRNVDVRWKFFPSHKKEWQQRDGGSEGEREKKIREGAREKEIAKERESDREEERNREREIVGARESNRERGKFQKEREKEIAEERESGREREPLSFLFLYFFFCFN